MALDVTNIIGQAKSLLSDFLTRQTKVYDASNNRITVSGLVLDGVVTATLSGNEVGVVPESVDSDYFAFYDVWKNVTLTVELLPTAKSVEVLTQLYLAQTRLKGYCKVTVVENGTTIGAGFRGYITTLPEKSMAMEGNNRTFVFTLHQPKTTVNTTINSQTGSSDGISNISGSNDDVQIISDQRAN